MNVEEIVKYYLKSRGFDGLHNDQECGCDISELFCCGDSGLGCNPGYKVTPPAGIDCGADYFICSDRNCKPWEE